jgi:haloalkane dehalogenase
MEHPHWLDRSEYPFAPHFFDTSAGRLHYVNEGQGEPVVFVHGTPTWSFLYRHLIKGLSKNHRCIAPDHLGFGLSDKPANWTYTPQDHARNLKQFIDSLGLRDITLVVHDFGGPIGLSYALENPANVKRLVLFNTWMWSVKGDPHFERPAKWLGGALGRFLYSKCNFAVNVMMKRVANSKLSSSALAHYAAAQSAPEARHAAWVLARELTGSSEWFAGLARQKEKIANHPALVLWGLKDGALPRKLLQNWSLLFTRLKLLSFEDAGHFVMEDKGAELVPILEYFLRNPPPKS